MYRFALRPRWLVLHLLLLVVVGLFAVAGVWQLDRLDERRAHNLLVKQRLSMPGTFLTRLLSRNGDVEYRSVVASGRYDTEQEVILVGRGREERPGNHVLTPLVTDDGHAVVVDRGWVPPDLDSPPVSRADPPGGRVNVVGWLLPSEGGGGSGRTRRLSRIDVARMAAQLPYPTYDVYLLLLTQDPPQGAAGLPRPVPLPELTEGNHLVYAIQWFLFMPIALVGYGAIVRREAHKRVRLARPGASGA